MITPEQQAKIEEWKKQNNYVAPTQTPKKSAFDLIDEKVAMQPEPEQNYFQKVGKEFLEGGKKITESVTGGAQTMSENMPERVKAEGRSPIFGLGGFLEGVVQAGAGAIIGGAQTIFSPITPAIQSATKWVTPVLRQQNPELAKAYDTLVPKLDALAQKYPKEATIASDVLNSALLLIGGKNAPAKGILNKPIQEAIPEIIQGTKNVTSKIIEGAPKVLENTALKAEKNAWIEPTKVAKPAYNKATEVYKTANSDIGDTLVNNGIRLSDNVEGGKFSTSASADILRSDAAKASNELLRPTLEEVSPGIESVPVDKIAAEAKRRVRMDRTILESDKQKLINSINNDAEALKTRYPDGMSVLDMHDQKIAYGQNVKRNIMGDINLALNNQKNEALRDVFMDTVNEKFPLAKTFNQELTKQYKAADYLDELQGKSIPQGVSSKIARTTAKVVGASVGSQFGGGVLGGVGGYHIGGMVESLIEGMPTNLRGAVLKNLEKTNPEVFAQVQKYLSQSVEEKSQRLLLPETASQQSKTIQVAPTGKQFDYTGKETFIGEQGPKKLPLNKGEIPTTNLLEEAKKYKSGEDFYQTMPKSIRDTLRDQGIKGQEQITKFWEDVTGLKSEDTYQMSHRPTETGAIASDISNNGELMPKNVYTNPEYYFQTKAKGDYGDATRESFYAVQKIKGKPEADITIYRASPSEKLNNGDWVTLSKKYAELHSGDKMPIHSFKVKAKDIQFAGDDINEFGYYPQATKKASPKGKTKK